ncbi:hypothetical protein ACN4EK_15175 [Pantanalinema rosaneae CENA516]|uniref:hypothetical protein n=1 Tax=Pantanalinema rosaneae TaxID=1620701 RepID=UPI003D6F2C45
MPMLYPPKSLLSILLGVLLVPIVLVETAATKPEAQMAQMVRSPILLAQRNNFTTFFEEGRLSVENQLRRQPPDPTIPVAQNSQVWQPIFFRSGGFSFWLPPGTLSQETVVLPTRSGNVSFQTLAANSASSRYVVGYAEELTPEQLKNPQLMLVAIANQVVTSPNFRLVRNQSVTQGEVPGRELTYQSDTEVIVFRAFLRGKSGYVIGAKSPKSGGSPSRQTTIFLNSLSF